MRPIAILILLALSTAGLAGCSHSGADGDQAAIDTTHGCILIEFYSDEAPQTVDNFIEYAEDGFYERTIFHRIIQSFMIQGGGFTTEGEQKETRDPIPLEYEVPNERGNVAMARTPEPDSATSQFFINTVDNSYGLGPDDPNGDGFGYAVFARVVEGMDVVDAIAAEPTGQGPMGQQNWPQNPPVIEGVRVGEDCGEQEPVESIPTEYIPLWVRNLSNETTTFNLTVDGPDAWNVTLGTTTLDLNPNGQQGDAGTTYLMLQEFEESADEDLVRVHIASSGDADASLELEIRTVMDGHDGDWVEFGASQGSDVEAGLITNTQDEEGVWNAALSASRVSGPGDSVTISYVGSFDNGEEFDSGSFSTNVLSGQTVAGFDTGLLGMEEGETVDIRFPPEAGYGYQPGGGREQFAGEWLNFEITLDSLG